MTLAKLCGKKKTVLYGLQIPTSVIDLELLYLDWRSRSWLMTSAFNIISLNEKPCAQFWLAKSTRIIHHNQLLMTKFGRILCLTRKWRQKCSLLQVDRLRHRYREYLGTRLSCFGCEKKMAYVSLVSRVRTTAGTRLKNSSKHGKNSTKITRMAPVSRSVGKGGAPCYGPSQELETSLNWLIRRRKMSTAKHKAEHS